MTLAQILALAIFVIMFVMIVLDKIERQSSDISSGVRSCYAQHECNH